MGCAGSVRVLGPGLSKYGGRSQGPLPFIAFDAILKYLKSFPLPLVPFFFKLEMLLPLLFHLLPFMSS